MQYHYIKTLQLSHASGWFSWDKEAALHSFARPGQVSCCVLLCDCCRLLSSVTALLSFIMVRMTLVVIAAIVALASLPGSKGGDYVLVRL